MSLYRALYSGCSAIGRLTSQHATSSVSSKYITRNCRALSSVSVVPFKLADIGEGIAEVEIMKWFVKAGDTVKAFDRLCEVQSDKATVEITSRFSGKIVKVYNAEGEIAKVGGVLVDIETTVATGSATSGEKSKAPASAAPSASAAVTAASSTTPSLSSTSSGHAAAIEASNSKVLTTPAVRKIAKENNIDLLKVPATGPKGRILKEDVLNILSGKTTLTSSSGASDSSYSSSSSSSSGSNSSSSRSHSSKADQVIPVRGIGRLMVKSMNAANQIKHLTLGEEIDFNGMISLRKRLKPIAVKNNIKLSYMPLLLKAISLALKEHPSINATVNSEATEVTVHGSHNIGVAMDTAKGLIVPVIKNVDEMSIWEIAKEMNLLQVAAAKGTISEDQLKGGSFSISNIGSVGGTYAVPVLVVPQVAIGAIGRIITNPKYVNSSGSLASLEEIEDGAATVAPVSTINVSWSADHRVVDGAAVAKFSNTFKKFVENPDLMLAEMR